MKLNEIFAYHGTSHIGNKLKAPIFLALRKEDAEWYAYSRGDEGYVISGEMDPGKVLDCVDADVHPLIEIASKVGVEFSENPYFYCAEIEKHSPYDGSNVSDLVYVPKIAQHIKAEGYNSVRILDVLTNSEIEAYVIFDAARFKILNTVKMNNVDL